MLVIGGGITGAGVALDAASGDCARPWWSVTTSPRGRRRSRPSSSTGACATCRTATSASCTKPSGSASACYATPPTWSRCCRSSSRCSRARAGSSPSGSPGLSARPCGCTTSPAACASGGATAASAGTPPSPTCPRSATAWRGPTSTTTPRPTTPASRSPWPARRPRLRRHGRQPCCRHRDRQGRNGRVAGAIVDTGRPPAEVEVRARGRVNATGVWADDVRALDEGTDPGSIRPAKGIHITVPWHKLRNDIAAVVPVRQDRRSVFVVPWLARRRGQGTRRAGRGTAASPTSAPPTPTTTVTSTTPSARPTTSPTCSGRSTMRSREPLEVSDVLGTWAGLRPLVRDASDGRTADLSRRHRVLPSASGVITVTGGKLTTYREMAQDAVDAAVRAMASAGEPLPRRARRSRSRSLALRVPRLARGPKRDAHLAGRYGGEAVVLEAMIAADPTMAEALVPGLPYRRARPSTRRGTRWPRPSTTSCHAAPAADAGSRRHRGGGRRRGRVARLGTGLVGARAGRAGRPLPGGSGARARGARPAGARGRGRGRMMARPDAGPRSETAMPANMPAATARALDGCRDRQRPAAGDARRARRCHRPPAQPPAGLDRRPRRDPPRPQRRLARPHARGCHGGHGGRQCEGGGLDGRAADIASGAGR